MCERTWARHSRAGLLLWLLTAPPTTSRPPPAQPQQPLLPAFHPTHACSTAAGCAEATPMRALHQLGGMTFSIAAECEAQANSSVVTALSIALAGRDDAAFEVTAGDVRPLKVVVVDSIEGAPPGVKDLIAQRLMPRAINILRRSVRVRRPSGLLDLRCVVDDRGSPVPPPPDGSPGYDADLVVQVRFSPRACGTSGAAQAQAIALEEGTGRPVFGFIEFCGVDTSTAAEPDGFSMFDVETAVHELCHVLGFEGRLFPSYAGYPDGFPVSMRFDPGERGRMVVSSPQVLATARDFFGCPELVGADTEAVGAPGSHWRTRIFDGHLMDPARGQRSAQAHGTRGVLTDLTLALLQDTNWYDVKYGSAGFSSWGYKGGCEFANGSYAEALQASAAARYLCTIGRLSPCEHDHSGSGRCTALADPLTGAGGPDPFHRVRNMSPSDISSAGSFSNCQVTPGSRCIQTTGFTTSCVQMRCSEEGTVLIEGPLGAAPCDPAAGGRCPDDEEMCVEPGYLTCRATLNDCSGVGDCYRGRCFCHTGFGGDDCSVPLCIDVCPDDSPCPPSGFCGEPECGAFSSGSLDRGIPCNSAVPGLGGSAPLPGSQPDSAFPPPGPPPPPGPLPSPAGPADAPANDLPPTPDADPPAAVGVPEEADPAPAPALGLGVVPPPPPPANASPRPGPTPPPLSGDRASPDPESPVQTPQQPPPRREEDPVPPPPTPEAAPPPPPAAAPPPAPPAPVSAGADPGLAPPPALEEASLAPPPDAQDVPPSPAQVEAAPLPPAPARRPPRVRSPTVPSSTPAVPPPPPVIPPPLPPSEEAPPPGPQDRQEGAGLSSPVTPMASAVPDVPPTDAAAAGGGLQRGPLEAADLFVVTTGEDRAVLRVEPTPAPPAAEEPPPARTGDRQIRQRPACRGCRESGEAVE